MGNNRFGLQKGDKIILLQTLSKLSLFVYRSRKLKRLGCIVLKGKQNADGFFLRIPVKGFE